MNISNDFFYKVVAIITLLFFMAMYAWSFATGKTIDFTGLYSFIVPIAANFAHLLYSLNTNSSALKSASNGTQPEKLSAIKGVLNNQGGSGNV